MALDLNCAASEEVFTDIDLRMEDIYRPVVAVLARKVGDYNIMMEGELTRRDHCFVKTTASCDLHGIDTDFLNKVVRGRVRLEFVSELQKEDIPSIVICPIINRLGSSVDHAIKGLRCHKDMALLLFHHQPRHVTLDIESEMRLTEDKYSAVGSIIDVVYWSGDGVYKCRSNDRAVMKLRQFLQIPEDNWTPTFFSDEPCLSMATMRRHPKRTGALIGFAIAMVLIIIIVYTTTQ